jgi:hypothetical protein
MPQPNKEMIDSGLQKLSKILDKYEQQLGSGSLQQFELLELLKGLHSYRLVT